VKPSPTKKKKKPVHSNPLLFGLQTDKQHPGFHLGSESKTISVHGGCMSEDLFERCLGSFENYYLCNPKFHFEFANYSYFLSVHQIRIPNCCCQGAWSPLNTYLPPPWLRPC
jgi:hypothetical protein